MIYIERQGELVGSTNFNLAADISTGAISPIYAPMLTAALTTLRTSSFLAIAFNASVIHTGVVGINVAATFRLLLNGVVVAVSRGATQNQVTSRIMTVELNRRIAVTPGVQTVLVEWTRFGAPLNLLQCRPVTVPELEGAQLILEEQAA